jgi:hypothetical protein
MGKEYYCGICEKKSSQKSHHEAHLLSEGHKDKREILRLRMDKKQYFDTTTGKKKKGKEKGEHIENILDKKENQNIEVNESTQGQKYNPSNKVVWESTNIGKFNNTDTKEKIMKIIRGVQQVFYDHSNTKEAMTGISKILAIILVRPLFLDKDSYIWEKIEDLEINNLDDYINYCIDLNTLLKCEDPINDWKDMVNDMLVKIFPGYFNINDSKISCSHKCFNDIIIEMNKIPEIFGWSPENSYKINYKISKEKYSGDLTGDINEYFKNKYGGSGKELGQFFTPPKLINAILEGLDIISHIRFSGINSIYDPCLGSAGFLVSTVKQIEGINLLGGEKDRDTIKWAFQSLLLETGEIQTNIKCGDSIISKVGKGNILTNPPFKIRMSYKNEKKIYESNNTSAIKFEEIYPLQMNDPEALFIQHCVYHLDDNCICSIILPYGKIFESPQKRFVKLRKWLVENVDITDLMLMPRGVFDYADPLTCNLVFVKRKSKGIVRITELNKECSKIIHLFDITTNDIINSNKLCPYSLSYSDYMYHELPSKLIGKKYTFKELFTIIKSDISSGEYSNQVGAPYKLVTGAKYENWLNIENYNYDGEFVFICLGGNGDAVPIKYHNGKFKFSNLMGMLQIKPEYINNINVKYIYHLLLSNQKYIETYMQKGSSNRTLHCDRIDHLILTIPPIDEQNKYVKEINHREEEYERKKNELLQYKQDTDNIISEMFPINLI